LTQQMDAAKEE